ncbi:hypothetical protein BDA96_07G086000 [Sorghum bicolor]|uniref:RWP-RK domain-containing protein n=1 Tax=Sorghum bicolor TaxID=4558 RepID=A0A921U8V8_SORBI|nr:hypothetical protein BDA96_07G086000 [Sorghum bicolor]
MPGGKSNRLQGARPQWDVVRGMLHMRLKDVAAELDVSITYLRRLCRRNGFPKWPGKQIRFMNGIRRNDGLPWVGLAGPSQLAKITEAKKKEEDDMTGIQAPVANHHPGQELITLNLIDKVGSSSSSELS